MAAQMCESLMLSTIYSYVMYMYLEAFGYKGCVYTGSPMLIFVPLIGLDQSHQSENMKKICSEVQLVKPNQNWVACVNAVFHNSYLNTYLDVYFLAAWCLI